MAVPNEEKLQEFYDARDAIVRGVEALEPSTPQEALQHVFSIAHDEGTRRVQTNLLQQVLEGNLDYKDVSIRIDAAGAIRFNNEMRKNKGRQAADTQRLLAMLDGLNAMADALAPLREEADEAWGAFSEKYGGRDGVFETFLSDIPAEDREGMTDEEIQQALVEKYMNPDGTFKPEADGLFDAEDRAKLEQMFRYTDAKDRAQAYAAEVEANGGTVSEDLKQRIGLDIKGTDDAEAFVIAREVGAGSELEGAVKEADDAEKLELAKNDDIGSTGFSL